MAKANKPVPTPQAAAPVAPVVAPAKAPEGPRYVELKSKHDRFVDQVVGTAFTSNKFIVVEWHQWLQDNIDAGWLVEKC
jgi:hypothetical protein